MADEHIAKTPPPRETHVPTENPTQVLDRIAEILENYRTEQPPAGVWNSAIFRIEKGRSSNRELIQKYRHWLNKQPQNES